MHSSPPLPVRRSAGSLRIPVTYLGLGLAWVLILALWRHGGSLVVDGELVGGSVFVLLSAAALHLLMKRDEAREPQRPEPMQGPSRDDADEALVEALAAARERALLNDAAVASSVNGIAILDAQGRVVQANAACAVMLGRDPTELVGTRLKSLMETGGDRGEPPSGPTSEASRREYVVRHGDTVVHIHMTSSPIPGPDGTVARTVAVLEDLSERHRQEERIAHLARYDALTDLPNRQLFLEQARGAIARADRAGHMVGILFLDGRHRSGDRAGESRDFPRPSAGGGG